MNRTTLYYMGMILFFPALLCAQSTLEVSSPPVPMGSLAYLDARNGFRDATLGSPFSSFKDLQFQEEGSGMKWYRRPSDNLTMGEATLTGIFYGFYNDHLIHITLKTDGLGNNRAVLATLEAAYGTPLKPNQFLEKYFWIGKQVGLTYEENMVTKGSTVIFMNHELSAQKNAADKERAKKAASGL